MTKLKFNELNLSSEILDSIKDMGFEEATDIQSKAIPLMMQGGDIIGQAQTGTGKTAAFAIPVIEAIDPKCKDIQAVILCPTRELVIQVTEEFEKLLKYKDNLAVISIYGGQSIETQLKVLQRRKPQILVGTPGRTMDHMRRSSVKLRAVKIAVLDEADEMLDMGFREDIEIILQDMPQQRQTAMFSATMAENIIKLTKKYQNKPTVINVTNLKVNTPKIEQLYYEIQEKNKLKLLMSLLENHDIKLSLIFCNTKRQVDNLTEILRTQGYFADSIHGDMSQNTRTRVMNGFKNGAVEILVATDVAGRGIDVNNIEAVFNYDLPRDDEDYIHRIGRTARSGKTGTSFTFVTRGEVSNLRRIERMNNLTIHKQNIPTLAELEEIKMNAHNSKINKILQSEDLSQHRKQVEVLMANGYDVMDIAAALLKMTTDKPNTVAKNFPVAEEIVEYSHENTPPRRRFSGNKFRKRMRG